MPLRVIDVEATIKNCETGGICFVRSTSWHIISHTWSTDVGKFSKIIGERVEKEAAAADDRGKKILSYEALFQAAGFTSEPAYQKLVEFLTILRNDKVRWVWIDAVCINQTDPKEKDREIQHMGTYYQSSLGCYVVHHGIGNGFNLLLDDDAVQKLPRWFSRAWTFQEWVLPPKTTFIIDLDSEETLRKTAATALSRELPNCFCCKVLVTSILPDFLLECMPQSAKQQSSHLPPSCSFKLFCRRPKELLQSPRSCHHFTKVPGKEHWYFMDNLGYAFLVKVKFQMKTAAQGVFLSGAGYEITQRIAVKESILRSRTSDAEFDPGIAEVIKEISMRDCTFPEDRLLSVLKLLGVENAIQVRTGNTLEMQLHELSSSLTKRRQEKLLLQLCLVEGCGSEIKGMSWMPEFQVKKGSWQEDAIAQRSVLYAPSVSFKYFKAQMRCRGVCSSNCEYMQDGVGCEYMQDGMLHLEGEVCAGELIFRAHNTSVEEFRKENYDDEEYKKDVYKGYELRTMVLEVDGHVVNHLCARISQKGTYILEAVNFPNQQYPDCYPCISFPTPSVERIPVWLLKMGYTQSAPWFKQSCLLVCLGEQLQSPLHKIGYMATQVTTDDDLFSKSFHRAHCLVGGLGNWPWF